MENRTSERTILRPYRFVITPFLLFLSLAMIPLEVEAKPTRSTNIALSANEAVLVVVNTEADSVTIFNVSGNNLVKRNEVKVGLEPRCVAIHSGRNEAFVTNSESGTVSVISLATDKVVATIPVGPEPRACALTPGSANSVLYVASYTAGFVRAINPANRTIVANIGIGRFLSSIAITDTTPPRVFVTRFFARLKAGGAGEGFDEGKEGLVASFAATSPPGPVTFTTLSPLTNSGFTANRSAHCNVSANPDPIKQTFCPNPNITNPTSTVITQDPQAVFPNQFGSALICGLPGRLYLPNIGAQPEPPVVFNTNVQALVHVVNTSTRLEVPSLHVNLNNQIKTEVQPANPFASLNRLFGNDVVAIDASANCQNFYIVSRGGNYVLRARPTGPGGALSIGAPNNVVRFLTGNTPTGIAVNNAGTRIYVNNEVNMSVTVIAGNTVIARDVDSSTPPVPGNIAHSILVGKLAFHTALGVPNNGLTDIPLRSIVPLRYRGKQSDNAWSTCASCHPDGLADGVTWIFADGPRQTIPLDSSFSKINPLDARIENWSAVRDSPTDFNNNSRNVQCGTGFAGGGTNTAIGCPPFAGSGVLNPAIFDHGISQGASEALDMETLWIQTVRPLNEPKPAPATSLAGATVFRQLCSSCHGGAKWTKSQVIYLNNPTLNKAAAAGGTARDPGLTITANQIVSYKDPKVDPDILKFLEIVGTFNPANKIEIRQNGQAPLGALGFNVPSLLGVGANAPYFHDGSAQTLEASFLKHRLPGGGTIQTRLSATQRVNLVAFLKGLDGRSGIVPNETDLFKDPTK
jgi:YVTN family beta-propeller protein